MSPVLSALDHLLAHVSLIELRLARHVAVLRASGRFNEDPFRGLYVGEREVDAALIARSPDPTWRARTAELDAAIGEGELALARQVAATPKNLPLERLARAFDLGAVDIAALVAAVAASFDNRFETLFAYAQNDAGKRHPTAGLVLDLMTAGPAARRDGLLRFTADAPLRAFQLLAPPPADTRDRLLAMPLQPDATLLPLLLGAADTTEPLRAALTLDPQPLPPTDALAAPAAALHRQIGAADRPVVALLRGPQDAGQLPLAQAEAGALAARLALLDLAHPACAACDSEQLAALAARALRLADAALFVDLADDPPDRARLSVLIARAARPGRPVFLAGSVLDSALAPPASTVAEITLTAPREPQRRAWWRLGLAAAQADDPDLAARLSRSTRLGPVALAAAIAQARKLLPAESWPPADPAPLTAAARCQAGPTLARLAQPVDSPWSWDDLVLPAEQRDELELLAVAAVEGPRIAADWGFNIRGLPSALVALFGGPSGTGKTMAAGLIARRAGLPLFRVDLSAVVSKYIGETEKQLDRLLREAEALGAALLFDEADALFGKRAEVKDARDRYANQEVAFLLQRIEAFDGLVILTTNLSGHIDQAFMRRIAYAVHFPMPDAELRTELWRRAFPRQAPLGDDLDLALLARTFEIAGGNIRNAALGAAHLASSEKRAIMMRDVVRAVAREVRKLGRLPSRTEFGPLYAALTPNGRPS